MSSKAKSRRNPGGLQGFLTKSGRKIRRQDVCGEILNRLLYAKEHCVGFMIIFGKDERAKLEDIRETLSDTVRKRYDEARTYRDGKWVMFEPEDTGEFDDYMKLLAIKRKPNRK